MLVIWLWLLMSLVGSVWTIRLLLRAQARAKIESARLPRHPVRVLAEARVRNQWFWIGPFLGGFALGVVALLKDILVLPFEIPPGVSVVEILALMGVAMIV